MSQDRTGQDRAGQGNQPSVILRHATLNGQSIEFCSSTEFLVQTASPKGSYRTRYRFQGNLGQAVLYFNAINLGWGWRKRLLAPSFQKPVLAKAVG